MHHHEEGCPTCRGFRQVGTTDDGIRSRPNAREHSSAAPGVGGDEGNRNFEVRGAPFAFFVLY
jgi:hypothetical protein